MNRLTRAKSQSPELERRRTIVLWGGTNSGKSGLIGALRSESTKSVGDRWAIDLDNASPDVIAYADSASLALRLRGVKETSVRRTERAFTALIRRYTGRRATVAADLTVLDPRGDLAADPSSAGTRRTLAATKTADAMLWLLEAPVPGSVPGPERTTLLRQLIGILEAASATAFSIPVAVALTKIDRLPQAEMNRLIESPEAALRSVIGEAAFGWLLAAFPRVRCFAFTSAGTVRNVVRPLGLTTALDWFTEEWRREEHRADAARRSARISAGVARVRSRAPFVATIAAGVAIVAFAGVAAARLLGQRAQTWTLSAGAVATQSATRTAEPAVPARVVSEPSVDSAAAAIGRGQVIDGLRILADLRLRDSSTERIVADSVLALAALAATEQALNAPSPPSDVLQLIVTSTSGAIVRAHPGTAVLAPLSLARAAACMGGHLNCPPEQVREDLAWVILLGTPSEQDQARRLRAALVGDAAAVQ
jgi:GTP-binding protein EngB required for normal cell division